jgi:GT2 family glycosyltransferase
MNTSPLVTIVILNWQNAPDTIECLASVARLSYQNYQTIIVDNGSKDNSVSAIQTAFPGINLIALPENLGYAAGNNVGILQAINSGTEYIFVLNNDTLLAPNILQQLVTVAEENPEVGMVGPKMYCYPLQDVIFAAGSMIQWRQGDVYHRGMFLTDTTWNDPPVPEPVDFITGCGVLVRRSLIETVGTLDTLFFLNYEDIEWCVRAQRMGFAIWITGGAGFIGSNLAHRLLGEGHEVTIFDNLSRSGCETNVSLAAGNHGADAFLPCAAT